MFPLSRLLTVKDVAFRLQVHTASVYQSLPGADPPKLGRCLPTPIRFGVAIRWTEEDIDGFVESLAASAKKAESAPTLVANRIAGDGIERRKRGRPKKLKLPVGRRGGTEGAV